MTNTGGMGAVSPVPFFSEELKQKTIERIIKPTIEGFKSQNLNYRGFVFFGLIVVNNDPYVIEYNVRMGDPETEVVIPRINESLSAIFADVKEGELKTRVANKIDKFCTTVFSVSGGYPEGYEKGKEIKLATRSETLFHAGTQKINETLVTSGGRVLAATCFGNSMQEALNQSYKNIDMIEFDKKVFRTDIGQDLKKFF